MRRSRFMAGVSGRSSKKPIGSAYQNRVLPGLRYAWNHVGFTPEYRFEMILRRFAFWSLSCLTSVGAFQSTGLMDGNRGAACLLFVELVTTCLGEGTVTG
jgi:hypothetical protein